MVEGDIKKTGKWRLFSVFKIVIFQRKKEPKTGFQLFPYNCSSKLSLIQRAMPCHLLITNEKLTSNSTGKQKQKSISKYYNC